VLAVAVADGMSGHAAGRGDNADRDAVLQRPRRAGPASAAPVCSRFAAASSARLPMTTRSECSLVRRLARAGARPAPRRPARPSIWACGPTAAICCSPAESARSWTTDRSGMYSFPRPFCRGAGQLAGVADLAADRASVSRLTTNPSCMRANPAPGSRSLLWKRARRSAAIPDTAKCPAARPPPPSCPMRRGVLAYHRRDNVTGQIRAQIRPPGPSAKITQGTRPLRQEPVHAT
jgi:hypothetical protein